MVLMFLAAGKAAVAGEDDPSGNTLLIGDVEPKVMAATPLNPAITRARHVQVNLNALGTPGNPAAKVRLNLFEDADFAATFQRTESNALGSFAWIGPLEGTDLGQAVLVVTNGVLAGKVSMPGAIYEIRPVGGGLYVVEQIDQSAFPPEREPIKAEPSTFSAPAAQDELAAADALNDTCQGITVLVAYTPEASAADGGTANIEARIALAAVETNQSYVNSDMVQRIHLVHVLQTAAGDAANDFDPDLAALKDLGDGKFDEVDAARETYHADEVALIIENDSSCGLGYVNSNADSAFVTVHRTCATGNYSFGHELGHNMGALHDWYVDDAENFHHGFVYIPARWRTIMAYNDLCEDTAPGTGCDRLQFWSNPNIQNGGVAMGVASDGPTDCDVGDTDPDPSTCAADNHKRLNETCDAVAKFRTAPLADLSILKTHSPEPAIAGKALTYTISVTNNGPEVALGVQVTDLLPSEVTFVATTGVCDTSALPTLVCDLGDLAANATKSFQIRVDIPADLVSDAGGPTTITNTATAGGLISDLDPFDNEVADAAIVVDEADLRLSKECKPDDPLLAGGIASCTIVVENLGPSTARDVEVIDAHVSDGTFNFGTVTTTAGSCSKTANPQVNSGTVTCDLGDVDPGVRITITVPITADTPQNVNDEATVSSLTEDPNHENDKGKDGVTFESSADLSLTKTALGEVQEPDQPGLIFNITAPGQAFPTAPNYGTSPDAVTAGRRIRYEIEVTNTGPSEASNVVVKDTLPAGVSFYPGSIATGQGSCETQTAILTCSLGNMPFGRTNVIRYEVLVDPAVSAGEVLLNSANVTSDAADPDTGDNSASTQTVVNTWADMSIIKLSVGENVTGYSTRPPRPIVEDLPGQVTAGLDLRYEITVQNNGASDAQNVQVLDLLPGQTDTGLDHDPVTFVNAVGADCQPMDEQEELGVFGPAGKFGQVLWCELGAVPAGARKTFHIYTHVDPSVPDGQTLTNGAFVWWGAASPPAEPGSFLPFPFPQIPPELPTTDDPFLDNNFHATDTAVNVRYNLAIVKTSDADVYKPSSTAVYTVTVVNQGPSVVADTVEVTDTLPDPKQVKYLEDNGDCVWDGNKVLFCELGPMAPSETKAFDIYATIFGSQGNVYNTAELTNGTAFDVYNADNTSTRKILVQGAKSKKPPKAPK